MPLREKSFKLFKLVEDEFKPYYSRENDFGRLLLLHGISAFITCPLFCYLVAETEVARVYYHLALSYTIMYPLYALLGILFKGLRQHFINFFIIHIFLGTIYCFQDLLVHEMDLFSQYSFFCMYALFVFILQRFYPVLIYNAMVFCLMVWGFQNVDNPEISKYVTLAFYAIVAICGTLVIWSRRRMIKSIEDYSAYLKKIINNPEISFVLFHFVNQQPQIKDYNAVSLKLLGSTDQDLEEDFFKHFDSHEIESIRELRTGRTIEKELKIGNQFLKIEITEFLIQRFVYKLARIFDVTEEIREKRQLEENERRYKDLFYKNQSGIFTTDKRSVLLDFNKVFEEFFAGELQKGDRLYDYIDTKEWDSILEMMQQKESIKNYQTHIRLKNGSIKWFVFNWFMDAENQQVTGIITDVTNTQKTAQQLSFSEEKFRLIFEESNDIIFLLEEDVITDTNRKGYQSFGIAKSKLINQTLWDLSHDQSEDARKKYEQILDRLRYSKNLNFEWLFESKGHVIDATVSITEITLENKVFYQCVIHDESELKKSMQSIAKSQMSFKSITENSPDGMLIISENKIVYTNPELFNLFEKEEITEQDIFDLDGFNELMEHHLKNNSDLVAFCKISSKKGDEKNVKIVIMDVLFEDKESSLVILRDVSLEQRMIHEKLRAELAEETSKKLVNEINERVQAEKRLQEQFLRSSAIFNSSQNTLLITLNKDFCVTYFNIQSKKQFSKIADIELNKGVELVAAWTALLAPVDLQNLKKNLKRVFKKESIQFELLFSHHDKNTWMEIYLNPIFNIDGNVNEISLVAHDISEKKLADIEINESLKEKEILLKEIHHRVKNNMQIISSILNLQSSFVKDKKTLEVLGDSRNRIRTMAIIHESLYQNNDFSAIDFSSYVQNLCSNIVASYATQTGKVQLVTAIDKISLVLDQAIPCGLIINELITNALKYAFTDGREGEIKVNLTQEKSKVQLTISDNGIGFKENFDITKSETLGMQLVSTLVEQLDGEMEIISADGIKYLITFEKLNS